MKKEQFPADGHEKKQISTVCQKRIDDAIARSTKERLGRADLGRGGQEEIYYFVGDDEIITNYMQAHSFFTTFDAAVKAMSERIIDVTQSNCDSDSPEYVEEYEYQTHNIKVCSVPTFPFSASQTLDGRV